MVVFWIFGMTPSEFPADAGDFKGLRELQEATGDDLQCGIVLYAGKDIVPFGEKLFAVPLSALWQ